MAVDVGASDSRPPLVSGERMDQAEFHRRYSMCPEIKVAELIEGVVHVGGRVTATHGSANAELAFWLGMYSSKVTGLHGGLHTTVILGAHNEFQPDCTLHIDTANGGRTTVDADDFVHGGPELVAEVVETDDAQEYGAKMNVYRRSGVQEYVVWQILEGRIDRLRLVEGVYQPIAPNQGGIIESVVFPGLRLNVGATLSGDLRAVMAALESPSS